METYPGTAIAHRFFEGTGGSYGLIVNVCTLGFDAWWKRRILREIPADAARIVDQACGTGILTFQIAKRLPESQITGVELRNEYLDVAKAKHIALKLDNVDWLLGRAEEIYVDGPVDCITSSYLAKYAELNSLIKHAKDMRKPGGKLVMHDFAYPRGAVFNPLWKFYVEILRVVGSRLFPEWKTVFHELPAFLEQRQWLPELLSALEKNKFTNITAEPLTWGAAALVTATRP